MLAALKVAQKFLREFPNATVSIKKKNGEFFLLAINGGKLGLSNYHGVQVLWKIKGETK